VDSLAKLMVVAGLALAVMGALLWLLGGRGGTLLPGDIAWQRGPVRIYFPVITCLALSLVLTLLLWLFRR
jgi:hypothetical protein